MTDSKYDPYDVDALEKSLNDSATRVSTIWISFLLFSLYLLTAVGTVTHRQLFLDGPIALPVLNIQLPLWGFFFLAPILFLIFHVYVLLQLQLLERTARAYNEALDHTVSDARSNAVMRQRLANTLFAQIFAGAPSERGGWFGACLKTIAWITMALAPILILLAFQFAFLPYHSHLVTWLHRLLIAIEIAVFMWVWPLVLGPRRNVPTPRFTRLLERLGINPRGRRWRFRLRLMATIPLYAVVCLLIGSFPGEPHVNLVSGKPLTAVECERWLHAEYLPFDRLVPSGTLFTDDETIDKIEKHISAREISPWSTDPARNLRGRDLNCSQLAGDLRHADFEDASLIGAWIFAGDLRGSDLSRTNFNEASLNGSRFGGSLMYYSQFRGAILRGGQFQGARIYLSKFQGADISLTSFQGAEIEDADLQGAFAQDARFQGASLVRVNFQGAQLDGAQFQGADLAGVRLQAASLKGASFQSASLYRVQLQGADLTDALLDRTELSGVWLWRAANADCKKARVTQINSDNVIETGAGNAADRLDRKPPPPVAHAIADFVYDVISEIPAAQKDEVAERMRKTMEAHAAKDDAIAATWSACQQDAASIPQDAFDTERATLLRSLVCDNVEIERKALVDSIVGMWISSRSSHPTLASQLARGLLGEDGKDCMATKHFDESIRDILRKAANGGHASNPPELPPKP